MKHDHIKKLHMIRNVKIAIQKKEHTRFMRSSNTNTTYLEGLTHPTTTVMANIPADAESKHLIVKHNEGVNAYRAAFGYPNEEAISSNPWLQIIEPWME